MRAAARTPAGRHELRWNGRTRGGAASAGVYFVRMTAEGRQWARLTPEQMKTYRAKANQISSSAKKQISKAGKEAASASTK